jgi:hypothetical protein
MIKPQKQAGKTLTETFPPNWNDLTSDHRIAWIDGRSGRLDSANDFPRNWDEKTVMGRAAWVWEFRNRIGTFAPQHLRAILFALEERLSDNLLTDI